jgi:hypothetical protein
LEATQSAGCWCGGWKPVLLPLLLLALALALRALLLCRLLRRPLLLWRLRRLRPLPPGLLLLPALQQLPGRA